MKRLFLIAAIIVGYTSSILAQTFPCDISSTGMELRNTAGTAIVTSMPANGTGTIRIPLVNIGTDPTGCAYPTGSVTAVLSFFSPSSVNNIVRYNGPASFTSGKYDFTWDPAELVLVGVNNQPIAGGLINTQSVLVPIAGVKVGTAPFLLQLQTVASSDDVTNNAKTVSITVVSATGGVLPVTITEMDGIADKCNAQVKWSTSNETNLKQFEMEVSTDGVKFEKAGTIRSSSTGKYQFNTTQGAGKAYYRLKIIDKDGSVTYSKIVPITTECNNKVVKVFPNPVRLDQLLNVNIAGYEASVKGDLYSATGQLVKSYVLKNGPNSLSVENLAQGFYTLRVLENGTTTETFKINVLQ